MHHKGTKDTKLRILSAFCTLLLAPLLAVFCSPLRASDMIDPEMLQIARDAAMDEWNGAFDEAMRPPFSERQMPRGAIGTFHWGSGVVGMVSYDLLKANPGREADTLLYVNNILIPEMHARRDQFVCGYARLHYHKHKWIGLFVDRGFTDPFVAITYFVTPTRDYLEQQNLDFTPRAVEQLKRHARFAPGGSFWRKIAVSKAYVLCKPQGDADFGPGERL